MDLNKQWYAVHTRPRWEKKTAELFRQMQIETYCPVNKVVRKWADRKKVILEPLFTSYCFVQIDIANHLVIRKTPGVINFVHWLGKPAIIREEEINLIKNFLNEHEAVKMEKLAISVNDRVRITRGAFIGQEAPVVEVRTRTVRIQLPAMGVALIAEVSKTGVEKILPIDSF